MDGSAATRHLGLDLGGTNIKWVVVERGGAGGPGAWRVVDRDQVPTPITDDPDAVVRRMADVGAAAIAQCGPVESVGIGVPGLYDPVAGTTRFLVNFPGGWTDVPVAGPIGATLGLPAALINDARAFGLAELRLGAGRGAQSMIGLTLGTGVGGVVAIDGRVHQGHDGTAGELGHQTIEPDGPWCNCGNRGCLEAFCRADQIAIACGTASPEEAVRRAGEGDLRAADGLAQIGRYLGIGIANIVTVITPERVVIGGGVGAAGDLLFEPIRAELRRRVRTTALDQVTVVAAELGTWAGGTGAAIHGAEDAGRAMGSRATERAASERPAGR